MASDGDPARPRPTRSPSSSTRAPSTRRPARLHITPSAVASASRRSSSSSAACSLVRSKPVAADRGGRGRSCASRASSRCSSTTPSPSSGGDAASARPTSLAARGQCRLARHVVPARARARGRAASASSSTCTATTRTSPRGCSSRARCMGAVTSQATPVAGCLVRPLGVMRYEAVATPAFAERWRLRRASRRGIRRAPLAAALAAPRRRLRPPRRPAARVPRGAAASTRTPAAALRARLERLRDGDQARPRLGPAARVPVDARARARRARAARRVARRRAAVLAAVEPALAAARRDRRRASPPRRARARLRATRCRVRQLRVAARIPDGLGGVRADDRRNACGVARRSAVGVATARAQPRPPAREGVSRGYRRPHRRGKPSAKADLSAAEDVRSSHERDPIPRSRTLAETRLRHRTRSSADVRQMPTHARRSAPRGTGAVGVAGQAKRRCRRWMPSSSGSSPSA